ncbi:MAG: sigma-70 family RNA polymerase sigma factor [Planctomycetes bacterium]|nr:sigma-70 family RNA polymerase sigma factor [Planctomycetota bacterium]
MTPEEELELSSKAKQGDMEARSRLVEANLRLVVAVAQRYAAKNKHILIMDLIEEGNIGLLQAVDKFDPERKFRFSTYAIWWIRQAIQKAVQKSYGTFSLPPYINDQIRQLKQKEKDFGDEFGRMPSIEELAKLLEKSIETVDWLIRIKQAMHRPMEPEDSEGSSIMELVQSKEDTPLEALFRKQTKVEIEMLLSLLDERERWILKMRYGLGDEKSMTLQEIGVKMKLTRERIRQIENEAIRKLKKIISYTTSTNVVLHRAELRRYLQEDKQNKRKKDKGNRE